MPAADYRILTDATGQRIATALEGVENNMIDKLPKDFSTLSALPADPATGDLLPIASNGTTYKIDYNALAAAILNRLGAGTDGIVDITHGGTWATTAADARANLGITGEEIQLLSNPLAINNNATGLQYSSTQALHSYKFVDLYFVVQGGYTNAIRLCPEYSERTYKFGFFAWHSDDNVIRKVAVAFTTAGRYFTNCVVRVAYGDNGAFNTADNVLYLYKAIGYKW